MRSRPHAGIRSEAIMPALKQPGGRLEIKTYLRMQTTLRVSANDVQRDVWIKDAVK
jgi:hypothetical protein